MELNHKTPTLHPGAWYVTFTSDDQMRPVYIQPINIEPDRTGVWRATFRDTNIGEFEVREGEKRFAFYARVDLAKTEDRLNPVLIETGELFDMAYRRRAMLEKQKELEKELATLDIARMTAGGTR